MKIAIGSDHAGFALKEDIKGYLKELALPCEDFGTSSGTKSVDDYPLVGCQVAEAVARGEYDFGILVCGTGIGMSIAANKVPGIRASLCNDLFSAKAAREHNDANVLTLGSRIVATVLAREIVKVWLETKFSGGRHVERNRYLAQIEEKYYKSRGGEIAHR